MGTKMKRATKKVMLVEMSASNLEEDLGGLINYLQEKLEGIPNDCRDSARIDFIAEEDYGSIYTSVEIYYIRPLTEEERLAKEEDDKAASLVREERELKEYWRLREKFEGNPWTP